jgi:glycosyltransferase involved in cell wall biosynthesis
VLLTAFGMFGARHPDSALQLRCVVPSAESAARLRALVAALQLDTRVAVVHSTRPSEVEALVAHSCAVIVPALYETVGEPIVQALAWGRPLLCSALPDLLDLADGAAVGFDPHQPTALLAVLEDLEQHPAVLDALAQRSRARWASLEGPETVARAFVQALQGAAC